MEIGQVIVMLAKIDLNVKIVWNVHLVNQDIIYKIINVFKIVLVLVLPVNLEVNSVQLVYLGTIIIMANVKLALIG